MEKRTWEEWNQRAYDSISNVMVSFMWNSDLISATQMANLWSMALLLHMAKRTRKRVKNNKDRSGCMWGFINIFEFRHGRPTHKLLADRKHESRRIAGAASPNGQLNKAEDSCEICKDVIAGEKYEKALLDKLSVKSLMREEMIEHIHPDKQGHERKKSWHVNKKSFDLNDVDLVSEKPTHRKHKSLSSLDVTGIMEELSSQAHVKNEDCFNHEQASEDSLIPLKEDSSVIEERLGEATRVFVRHFVDGRNTEEGKMQPSRELMEALHVLNSNKDVFLKLLRDPSSELVKHLEHLEDNPLENSKVQMESDLINQGNNKHQGFFWRRFKGLERNSSKNESPQDPSTIVVLKSQNDAMRSSPDIRSQDQDNDKGSFRFSFTEFTRKLKLSIRKENAHMDNVGGESIEMASPISDHFVTKELPKSSTPEQRISNIYTEAKKHLAEIVGNSDEDVDFLSRQDPESLGRILSYSNYNSSPISSPRKGGEQIAAQPVQEEGTCEETRNDLEVPNDELSPLHSAIDEIRAEEHVLKHCTGNPEMEIPDEFEAQNQISSDTLSEQRSRYELVEEILDDFEEEKMMELNLDDAVTNGPSSPLASSSSVCSTTEDFEDQEATSDRSERPSPISVLEPIFIDEDDSPSSVKSFSVSEYIEPRQIKFEEQVCRAPRSRTWAEEKNAVFEFIEAVARASALTHDQLLERFLFSENLLDPSLLENVCFHPDRLGYDPKLLFDLVDDVLAEVCYRDFNGIPSLYILMKLTRKSLVDEIRQGVDWHLQSEHTERTLDQTVAKDFSKAWTWMDLRLDSESTGVEMEEDILDELVEEVVTSFISLQTEI
ncbi:hypothetical protein V2J09_024290 [Rumex salicifolius]